MDSDIEGREYACQILTVVYRNNPKGGVMDEKVLRAASGLTFDQFEKGIRWLEERDTNVFSTESGVPVH